MALISTGVAAKWTTGTADDSTDIRGTSLIRADGAGTLVVKTVGNDTAVTFTVAAGETIQGQFTRLMTASTATGVKLGRFGGKVRGASEYLTMAPANYNITITSDSISRSFIVHVPALLRRNAGAVLAFHGGGGNGADIQPGVGLDAQADLYKFIAVYPNATDASGNKWTDGRTATVGGPDDILFVQDIITWLGTNYSVSSSKVFGIGISNGGLLLHWIRDQDPGRLAGICTIAANIPSSYEASVVGAGPVMTVHGILDPFMLYAGGVNPAFDGEGMASALETADRYAICNGGVASTYADSGLYPDTDPLDGCRWRTYTYTGTTHPVVHYRVQGGGHTWPGSSGTPLPIVGNKCTEFSATEKACLMFHDYNLW